MITIVSASFKSKALLDVNYRLVKALNPKTDFRWIVVQNTPASALAEDLPLIDDRFQMIAGPVLTDLEVDSYAYGSFHHAKALNMALGYAKSDLVLTLDPDCFIVEPNWIERVSRHMRERELVFFGSPYHPAYVKNYRRFPTGVCMFIDRRRMQEQDHFHLDFAPRAESRRYRKSVQQAIRHHVFNYKNWLGFFLNIERQPRQAPLKLSDWRCVVRAWAEKHVPQLSVGTWGDIGIRIFEEYAAVLRHEELQVYAKDPRRPIVKAIEAVLPDRFRTFPRNTGQIRPTDDPLIGVFECEQFFWQDRLFALHVQGTRFARDPDFREAVSRKLRTKIESVLTDLERNDVAFAQPMADRS